MADGRQQQFITSLPDEAYPVSHHFLRSVKGTHKHDDRKSWSSGQFNFGVFSLITEHQHMRFLMLLAFSLVEKLQVCVTFKSVAEFCA
jgi:hypothetical protein